MTSNQNDDGIGSSLLDLISALKNSIKAAYKIYPLGVIMGLCLVAWTIPIFQKYAQLGVCAGIFIILIISVGVFFKNDSYPESAVIFSTGMLALLSVDWDNKKSIWFFVAWVVFSFGVFLIRGFKITSQNEQIFLDAALAADPNNPKQAEKRLREIANKERQYRRLGPNERGEVLRLFAYRKIPVSSMEYALKATEIMAVITKADHNMVAAFVIDIYKIFGSIPGSNYEELLDQVFNIMNKSPVSPSEFVEAFDRSRRIALSGKFTAVEYFQKLTDALEMGASPDEIGEYFQ